MNATMRHAKATLRRLLERFAVARQLIAQVENRRARKAALVASDPTIPQLCREEAKKYGVIPVIHSKDFIFHFIIRQTGADPHGAVRQYFSTGDSSASKLRSILSEDLGLATKPIRLLEFASGYGCVSRHFARHPEDIALVVCDIHDEAGAFYAEHMGVPFIKSATVPEAFNTPSDFDIVFALSFFSHMPEKSWARWLAALFRCVAPGGHLIFTTHGVVSSTNAGMPKLPKSGFMFVPRSEQLDLEPDEYGSTITAPSFVRAEIEALGNARLALLREGEWWGHQDLYVVQKLAG